MTHKPLLTWTEEYLEQLEDTENSHLDFNSSKVLNDIPTIGKIVSAFANYDGGHIIIGVEDKKEEIFRALPDEHLDLAFKGGLKSWLEDKISHLCEPPVRNLDVKTFSMTTGALAVIEIRPSNDAPHRDLRTGHYYGRVGSKCYPLSHRQLMDIIQRQKSPTLEISPLEVSQHFSTENGPYHTLAWKIKNVANALCKNYHLTIEIPTCYRDDDWMPREDKQSGINKIERIYTDLSSDSWAHFVEIEGGLIYPNQEKNIVVRAFYAGCRHPAPLGVCRTEGTNWHPSRKTAKLTLFTNPTAIIKGETETAV
jgi:Putative DNA-binding domain